MYRALALICLCISGCASQPPPEEIQIARAASRSNWYLCEKYYRAAGTATQHNHMHSPGEDIGYVRQDLMNHRCRSLLRRACTLNQGFDCTYWINSDGYGDL
jgi:hypothetical protein